MKSLPIGVNDYKDIIKGNFVYVDKTKYIYELVRKEKGIYFLSRPRRFGKSLLLSTLYYLFKGEKELFVDTWIYDKWDWEEYPVIRIDLTDIKTATFEKIEFGLKLILKNVSDEYGIDISSIETDVGYGLSELIIKLYKKYNKPVVVLIDEYEKPVLDNITDKGMIEEIRNLLRGFYSTLKAHTDKIVFLLITGLTKFTKMGVFSALNNLNDISFDEKYSQMLGYTDEEIVTYFDDYINQSLRILTKYDRETILREIKNYYDGFKFDGIHDVYNPFAVLLFFDKSKFLPYWSESGSPAFLYEYLRTRNVKREDIVDKYITEDMFSNYEIEDNPPELFLAQAGYLIPVLATPKELGKPMYRLEIPNLDVEMGLEKILVSTKYKIELNKVSSNAAMMIQAVELEDLELMKKVMQKHLAEVNYEVWSQIESMEDRKILESEYQWLIASLFKMAGYKTTVEYHTSKGRIDILVETNGKVFIIELKVDESGKKALEQIKEKGYAEQFKFRKVYMIGIGINSKERNISNWEVEVIG